MEIKVLLILTDREGCQQDIHVKVSEHLLVYRRSSVTFVDHLNIVCRHC